MGGCVSRGALDRQEAVPKPHSAELFPSWSWPVNTETAMVQAQTDRQYRGGGRRELDMWGTAWAATDTEGSHVACGTLPSQEKSRPETRKAGSCTHTNQVSELLV